MTTTLSLAKAHAYGNDFVFIPEDQTRHLDPHGLARAVCARHTGPGADGLILYDVGAATGPARMTLYNADGSPSELSGNGLRCLAALLLHLSDGGERATTELAVATGAGLRTLTVVARSGSRSTFRAAMGAPTDVRRETLDVEGERLEVTTLGMGNPQCVVLVDQLPDRQRFNRVGPALSTHPRFIAGTNVEFAEVVTPSLIRIAIWERGVGSTLASGTGACAAAVAAVVHGGASRDLDVESPGGTQRVEWNHAGVYLTGWAELILHGQWLVPPSL